MRSTACRISYRDRSSTTIEDLPDEITNTILSHLPIKSILRCRCVCKTWLSLIDHPQFPPLHLTNQPNTFSFLLLPFVRDPTIAYVIDDIHDNASLTTSIKYSEKIQFYIPRPTHKPYLWVLGSSHGLVCLVYFLYSTCTRLPRNLFYICNPSLRQCLTLPEFTFPYDHIANLTFGFGFDDYSGKFKVVILYAWKRDPSESEYVSEALVNTVGTDSWRSIPPAPGAIKKRKTNAPPLVNGRLHWIDVTMQIVSFNMATEEFRIVPSPPDFMNIDEDKRLEVGIFDGLLSLTDCSNHDVVDLWVMKDYNLKSWIKQLSIRLTSLPERLPKIYRSMFLKKKKKLIMLHGRECWYCYDVENGKHNLLRVDPTEEGVSELITKAIPFTPSLISVNSLSKLEEEQ